MALFTDQLNRTVDLPADPKRIISLVPSQTELLDALGAGDRVVGLTRFCVRPQAWRQHKQVVGGTKQLELDAIRALRPDLILGNREENERSQIETLMAEFNLWMSDIFNLSDALAMIETVGRMLGRIAPATQLTQEIAARFEHLTTERVPHSIPRRAAYMIWRRPYMAAGHTTFITEMMKLCGFENIFEQRAGSRYPELSEDDLRRAAPEVILLSSEPYPFAQKHVAEFQAICPRAKVLLVDGEIFSWYGPRLLYAPAYFRSLAAALAQP